MKNQTKQVLENQDKAELYEALKYELKVMDQWTSAISDIANYQHNHLNEWVNYYEEISDNPPVNKMMYRTYFPKETKYIE